MSSMIKSVVCSFNSYKASNHNRKIECHISNLFCKNSVFYYIRFSDYYKDIIAPIPSFGQPQYQSYEEEEEEEKEKFNKPRTPVFNKPSGISLNIEEN